MIRKERGKKKLVMALAVSIAAFMPVPAQAAQVRLSMQRCVLFQGDQIDINVKGSRESSGTYRSSNKRVAVVSKDGVIKAKRTGIARISWTRGKKRGSCNIIVGKAPTVNRTSLTIKQGEWKKVSVLKSKNFKLKTVWNSANPEIAAVKNGKITGIAEGTTVITVKIKGYKKAYKRTITVTVTESRTQEVPGTVLPNQPSQNLPETEIPDIVIDGPGNGSQMVPVVSSGGVDIGNQTGIITGSSVAEGNTNVTQGTVTGNGVIIIIPGNTGTGSMGGNNSSGNLTTGGSVNTEDKEPGKVPERPGTENGNQTLPGNNGNTENEKPAAPVTGGSVSAGNTETPDTKEPDAETPPVQPVKSLPEQVAELVNTERAKQNLAGLVLDAKLSACAEIRAEELVDVFAHTRPDNTVCFTVLDENNIEYMACAENIAMGQKTAELVMNSWMNSTGHRKNILNGKYNKIGIGYVNVGGMAYWVQLFTD